MEHVTLSEADRQLGVSPTQAKRLLEDKKLRCSTQRIGNYVLVTKSSVEKLRAARQANPPKPGRPRKS